MPIFLVIARHSPENCAMFNEEARREFLELLGKLPELLKKHGVKRVGAWNVPTEHLIVAVFEASSLEAHQKFRMEPDVLALNKYNTLEIKLAFNIEELAQMLQQAK